jgi:hypothetical protein
MTEPPSRTGSAAGCLLAVLTLCLALRFLAWVGFAKLWGLLGGTG